MSQQWFSRFHIQKFEPVRMFNISCELRSVKLDIVSYIVDIWYRVYSYVLVRESRSDRPRSPGTRKHENRYFWKPHQKIKDEQDLISNLEFSKNNIRYFWRLLYKRYIAIHHPCSRKNEGSFAWTRLYSRLLVYS